MQSFLILILILVCVIMTPPASADCQSDSGAVDDIQDTGSIVNCDTEEPNPYEGGIGTTATTTDLTVNIAEGAELTSTTVGVALADGGTLENQGTITARETAITGTNQANRDGITINNSGTIVSTTGAAIVSDLTDSVINNSGTITAQDLGIQVVDSTIDNSGTLNVSNEGAVALDAGSDSSVDNSGSIRSDGVAIDLGTRSTLINSGTITGNGTSAVNSGSEVTIDNSGTITGDGTGVILGSGSTLTNTGTITGNDGFGIIANGAVSIDNAGSVNGGSTGAIELNGGNNTLTLRTGSDIQGQISSLPAGGTGDQLILEETGSENDAFSGFASLLMRGSDWTLSGPVEADSTLIESGTLTINNSLNSPLGIDLSGGGLSGTGTITGNVSNSAGIIAAGDPAGTLFLNGNYVQGVDGTFRVNSSNTNIGLLQVSGTADLAGELIVSAGPDLVADILIADGGITGAFDDISVDGRALIAVVPSANRIQIARVSTTLEDNMVEAGLDNAYLTLDTLASGIFTQPGSGLWVKGLGSYAERDEIDGLPGGDYTIAGGGAGGDWQINEQFRVGGLFAYTNTDLDSDDGSNGSADNYNYGLYASYDQTTSWGGIWGILAGAAGSSDYDQDRRVLVNDEQTKVSASYDGDAYAVRGIVGTRHAFLGNLSDTWVFEPSLGVDYVVLDLDDFQEQSGAALNYSIDDIESLQLQATLRTRRILSGDEKFAPRFQLGVVHRIAIDDREWLATGSGGGNVLTLPGNDEDVTSLAAAAGFEYHASSRLYAYADWLGEFSDDKRRHSLVLGIRLNLGTP
jgi:outer membrane autotransporter protein